LSEVDTVLLVLRAQAFLALALHSVYKTASREAEFVRTDSSQTPNPPRVILERFRSMIEQRDIAVTVLLITILAAVTWAIGVAVVGDQIVQFWAFSLGLVYGLVLFLAIETLYLLCSKWFAPSLRNNHLFVRAVDSVALSGSLVLALASTVGCMYGPGLPCGVFDWLGNLSFSVLFVIFFISGLGTMGIVDTISESISSRVPSGGKKHVPYLILLFGSIVGLRILLPYSSPILGSATGFGLIGADLAIVVGLSYLTYLVARRRESQESSSLVYVVLMLAVSGLFLVYTFKDSAQLPDLSLNSSFAPLSPEQLLLTLTLFSVAYLTLLLAMPRSVEQKLGIKQTRLVATITFLMLFTAVANYQRAVFSGLGPGALFYQKEGAIYPGVWVGAFILTLGKIRQSYERGKLRVSSVVPFCATCGKRLDANSKFCWACGSTIPSQPERVLFVSDATQIASIKERHSTKRKVGSLIAGGPMGYLAFGMDFPLKQVSKGQIAVTDKAVYFGGNAYPVKMVVQIKPGHYSNSIVLALKQFPTNTLQKASVDSMAVPVTEVELKSSNVKALAQSIEQAALVHA